MDRIKRLLPDERGSVLPFVAVTLFLLLACGAFALDYANYLQAQRLVQNAADSAALAGASDLPTSTTSASTDASTYAAKNVGGAATTVTVPYNGSNDVIKVSISQRVTGIFGGVLGIGSETVTASAVAAAGLGVAPSAFFASDTTCGSTNGIYVSGDNNTFAGGEHSNGSLNITGTGDAFGAGATYGGPNHCSDSANSGTTFGGSSGPTVDTNTEPWPWDPRGSLPACTYSATSFTWNTSNTTIPSGVYCATSTIAIGGNNLTGNVTFIAPNFRLGGTNINLTAYWDNLFIYDSGTTQLQLSGSEVNSDTVFAPNTTVALTASASTNSGFIEAQDITVSGSGWNFTGDGPVVAGLGSIGLTG